MALTILRVSLGVLLGLILIGQTSDASQDTWQASVIYDLQQRAEEVLGEAAVAAIELLTGELEENGSREFPGIIEPGQRTVLAVCDIDGVGA